MSRIKKYSLLAVGFVMVLLLISCVLIQDTYAAAAKPQLKNDPINGQMLPYYEVWLRWNDVSNESSYTMNLRDLTTDTSIYSQKYVSPNSTYFIVPTSVLTRGHEYRWCVCSVDASGNKTYSDAYTFIVESYSPDKHLLTFTYPTRTIEYFVYAETSGYSSVLNSAAQAWNGIANVSLVRTGTPSDEEYELGIFESPTPDNPLLYGRTVSNLSNNVHVYSECRTFRQNVMNSFSNGTSTQQNYLITNSSTYLSANAMHEVGHALGLEHTWDDTEMVDANGNYTYYDISETKGYGVRVPLIMNSGPDLGATISFVDRAHLRMKWGS